MRINPRVVLPGDGSYAGIAKHMRLAGYPLASFAEARQGYDFRAILKLQFL